MDVQSFQSPLSHFDATGLLDSLEQPLLVLDAECCVVFANASARRLLTLSMRELQGQPLDLLFTEGQRLRGTLARCVMSDSPQQRRPMRFSVRELARQERQLALKVTVFDDEFSGPHLLIQLARVRPMRRRPSLTLLPSLAADRPPDRPHLECA
jgi:nitrogen-specific signal transduction histidine kinase